MSKMQPQICLEDKVHEAIKDSPYLGQRTLRCEAQEGRIILRGQVGTFFQKQMAQEAVRGVQGITEIENHLEVVNN